MNTLIPIKNLYYILCYAFDVNNTLFGERDIGLEVSPNEYDLLAKVFNSCLDRIIKFGLYRKYVVVNKEIAGVKGKIDIVKSIKKQSISKNMLFCEFDEFSQNNEINTVIKYTLINLINNLDIDDSIRKSLRKKTNYFNDVVYMRPNFEKVASIRFDKNNALFRLILNVSILIYKNQIPIGGEGKYRFHQYNDDPQIMNKIFERFLFNFYRKKYSKDSLINVYSPDIEWTYDDATSRLTSEFIEDRYAPNRRTDVVIDVRNIGRIIIDAKYYGKTLVNAYMDDSQRRIRANHINQIRGYLLDSNDDAFNKIGVLIYPRTSDDFDSGVLINIKDTPIIYKTIDLGLDWVDIENDLMQFMNRVIKCL